MKGYIHTTQKNSNVINYPYVYISNLTVKWLFLSHSLWKKELFTYQNIGSMIFKKL